MNTMKPGRSVVLKDVPVTLLANLPKEDQSAISAIIGQSVTFVGFSFGQAEIEFFDQAGYSHTIWVNVSSLSVD